MADHADDAGDGGVLGRGGPGGLDYAGLRAWAEARGTRFRTWFKGKVFNCEVTGHGKTVHARDDFDWNGNHVIAIALQVHADEVEKERKSRKEP